MNLDKKMVQSLIVAVSLLLLTVAAAVSRKEIATTDIASLEPGTAGVISATKFDESIFSTAKLEVYSSQQVASPEAFLEDEEEETLDDRFMEATATQQEPSEWDGQLLVNVEKSLNVRAEASTESAIVGKMFKGAAATILIDEGEWVKIQSGDVSGYVSREFCVFGEDAKALAEELGMYYAISQTDGLRVRSTPGTDGKIYTVVDKSSQLKVVADAETEEGWVAIEYKGNTAYVSADYVEVSLILGKAITIEEYNKQLEQERAEKEAAKNGAVAKQTAAIAANVDDVTLLAALIHCEAGNQCYEGKLAVGAVVVNRIKSSRYPNDLRSVIYQSGQFGPVASGKLAKCLQSSISSSCIQAAQEALSGVDNVNGALHFNNKRCGKSGLIIGDHVFY